MTADLFILTGAPGTGKTAILAGLGSEIATVAEPAREVLAERRAAGEVALSPSDFVGRLLHKSIEKHKRALARPGIVVFDRGVPDCVAHAHQIGADPTDAALAAKEYRYHPEVLIAEPWADIYTNDGERTMSFELTLRFHEHLVAAYDEAGYRLVAVPQVALESRTAFVRSFVT